VDRAQWFDIAQARKRIIAGQLGLLEQLISALDNMDAAGWRLAEK
jgi:predicted NUDIX family NTP pyrophosphohydrolase